MGVFTSACRNCNEPIHWFVQSEECDCTKCGAHNTLDDLCGNRIDSAISYNLHKNKIKDRYLYEKIVIEYATGETDNTTPIDDPPQTSTGDGILT